TPRLRTGRPRLSSCRGSGTHAQGKAGRARGGSHHHEPEAQRGWWTRPARVVGLQRVGCRSSRDRPVRLSRARRGQARTPAACNPYPARDGEMAIEARSKGTGVASAQFLPGVRLVRAFNAINYKDLASQAHRAGEPAAIPLAGDDQEALATAQRLVRDAGFESVVVGPLSRAREFDVGTAVYTQLLTAPQLRRELGLK